MSRDYNVHCETTVITLYLIIMNYALKSANTLRDELTTNTTSTNNFFLPKKYTASTDTANLFGCKMFLFGCIIYAVYVSYIISYLNYFTFSGRMLLFFTFSLGFRNKLPTVADLDINLGSTFVVNSLILYF